MTAQSALSDKQLPRFPVEGVEAKLFIAGYTGVRRLSGGVYLHKAVDDRLLKTGAEIEETVGNAEVPADYTGAVYCLFIAAG
jgi:hypothetical protein